MSKFLFVSILFCVIGITTGVFSIVWIESVPTVVDVPVITKILCGIGAAVLVPAITYLGMLLVGTFVIGIHKNGRSIDG